MSDSPYLLGLLLTGRRVLVVGGGTVAGRRVPKLLEAGADVLLVAPDVTPALEDLALRERIDWLRRGYEDGDCAGAWLVQACSDQPQVNAAVAAEAEQRGIWCVRADDRYASSAWTPATGHVDGLSVGVLAEGPARRAAAVRDSVIEGLRRGTIASGLEKRGGGVALVGGGPGDPGLITVRGRQLLTLADVVIADRLAPRELLDELRADVEVVDAAKIPYGRAMSQHDINALLIARARAGSFVVRLKGGDPFAFGRGAEEALACAEAGVSVEVVPGVTSATAVPAAADVPVTHRGIAQEFHVASAHVSPDDPRSTVDWTALGSSRGTIVLLMAVENLPAVAETLTRSGRAPETPVRVIQDGTLLTQRVLTSTLANVAAEVVEQGIRSPAIVVVGDVVNVAQEIEVLRSTRHATRGP